ncbi:GAF domain-containing sensor histidine kinase [Pseudolysinimonas yzui]|uniref:Histidine kinase n=1 Tax=Pseudolysinimonas yzui TaxID=2708254 RepID=A0A8J3M3W3_9MICO|nr:GAF domain-containing protein [Pseudolysinimonas yzui]GHF24528.1 histidine kinase [Pseudolysinimonas yzui]
MGEGLGASDTPQSELERSTEELITHARRVLAAQGRVRELLRVTRVVVEQIELDRVLRTIVEAAVSLSGARYGALGVIAPTGGLEQFIHVGMPGDVAELIGHLPEGRGILGAVIDTGAAIRLEHLGSDERSSGFPAHHPPMDSFLGVPVVVRGEVFGNLYLTDKTDGPFSAEDEELVAALAATAGIAIDNARLFAESRRRERWSAALAEISATLLSGEVDDPLAVVVETVATAVGAELACLVRPVGDEELLIELARGEGAELLEGTRVASAGSLVRQALDSDAPVVVEALAAREGIPGTGAYGPTVAIPLIVEGRALGALTISRPVGSERFTTADLEMAADFARQTSVAIAFAQARLDREQLELVEERTRIARDLHDHVIQRLFGAGLALQSAASLADPVLASRITQQIDAIDSAISEIRTAIFTLQTRPEAARPGLRHRVLDVASEAGSTLGWSPRIAFGGAVDLFVDEELADDIVAVVREGLANVARHARAARGEVRVEIVGDQLIVIVEDDGDGLPARPTRSSGTSNLAERATARGGTFALAPGDPRGTRLEWSVPFAQEDL